MKKVLQFQKVNSPKLARVTGKASKVTKVGAGPVIEYFTALMSSHST
jgi:hypothetical protein